jgi:hypothetical protein
MSNHPAAVAACSFAGRSVLWHHPSVPAATERLFLPGRGASGSLDSSGLPAGWTSIDPPGFRRSEGSFDG